MASHVMCVVTQRVTAMAVFCITTRCSKPTNTLYKFLPPLDHYISFPKYSHAGAGSLILSGTIIFSGTCYFYALTGSKNIRQYTPYGGMLLILGWLAMASAGVWVPAVTWHPSVL
ncbi:Transmembrane protein 256 [Chionoecetes opilio]|uniref:Transmembrane protein 256 n=1 Tax=Chionoecetes opilio TaxID=41210 RepID=A0A8J4YCI6_CHIOP|nr:Transmembrane protein 256 [Chionoecetes opilio]